jgi:pimeloyl-ACP methyl ester carboxylesterase
MLKLPSVHRNEADLHFRVSGSGPTVFLYHPLTGDCRSFETNGLRAALVSAGYQCVTPDSIAHGASSSPSGQERYQLAERAADVLAVADAVGANQFAFVGYSMGAWIGTGLLTGSAKRMHFVVLGGWDPICGAHLFTKATEPIARRQEFMRLATGLVALRTDAPTVDADRLEGMARCYEELFEPLPSLATLSASDPAITVFCGKRDPYFDNARAAAHQLNAEFASCEGDHLTTFTDPKFTQQVVRWLERAWPVVEATRADGSTS